MNWYLLLYVAIGVASLVGVVVALLKWLEDRPALKLKAKMVLEKTPACPVSRLVFSLTVRNGGRTACEVYRAGIVLPNVKTAAAAAAGLGYTNEHLFVCLDAPELGEPLVLESGRSHTFRYDGFNLAMAESLGRVGKAFAEDSRGKRKVAKFHMRNLVGLAKSAMERERKSGSCGL